jgi:class 3 adenylate cyclase
VVAAGGFGVAIVSSFRSALEQLEEEREKSERLLLNVLPEAIAQRLKQGAGTIADSFESVTVLFADIAGFTKLSATVSPTDLVQWLNEIFSEFDSIAAQADLEKIKTIGDAYMVVGGLPHPRDDHAEAIAEMALKMQEAISLFNRKRGGNFQMRIGINSGPVVAGVIGTKKFIYDLWGDTVNTASRMESHGAIGEIQVTEATYELLKDKYEFEERGAIAVKGKGEMPVYLLKGKKENLLAEAIAVES